MNTMYIEQTGSESAPWLRFLSRWGLLTTLAILTLLILDVGAVGFVASDTALGPEYAELFQAVRSPGLYRAAMVADALGWLLIGGTLIIIAGLSARRAPIRAILLAACGIAQVVGSLGGFMRLDAVSAIAAQYANASSAQQVILRQSFLDLYAIIGSHFHAGQLLQGAGFLLAAWIAFSMAEFPRWLAAWLAFPGVTSLLIFVLTLAGVILFPLIVFHVVIATGGLHLALAIRLWRPSPARLSVAAAGPASVDLAK